MKGKNKFTTQEIEVLRTLVKKYNLSNNAADQKALRIQMRKLDFYVSDFGIQNITPSIFERLLNKGFIRCTNTSIYEMVVAPKIEIKVPNINSNPFKTSVLLNIDEIENQLIKGSFKKAGVIDGLVPDKTGFYCIRLISGLKLPSRYQVYLDNRPDSIIYIGKAEGQSLKKRFLGQELRAKGHGTFFRSIGAVLGYLPEKGSLKTAKNKNNYTFNTEDEIRIIKWINNHLEVNGVVFDGDFSIETKWISKYCPMLNDKHNPLRLKELKVDKEICRSIAIS